MMKIIALGNQKGGTGKTTSTINLGAGLAEAGKKVLLVDLDPQGHLTASTGQPVHELDKTLYEVLRGEIDINDALINTGTYYLLPSNITLSGAENDLAGVPGREFILKETLEKLRQKFDFILLDCPPSLGLLTVNGFVASDEVFIPLQTEYLPMLGMNQLLQVIDVIKTRLNKKLKVTGIIGTMYDTRKKLNQEVVDIIRDKFGDKVFDTLIRTNVSLAEAPGFGKNIFEYKPNSSGAEDYRALAGEVLKRG